MRTPNPTASLRQAVRRLVRRSPLEELERLPVVRQGREARAARNLERVYTTGQERMWDGPQVLQMLVERHGGVTLTGPKTEAVHALLSSMLYGELAAWKVSAALAARLPGREARMAATAQAHDEARHYQVIADYLELLGGPPTKPPTPALKVLERVVLAECTARQLVGMQLLVEPVALTLFTVLRRSEACPVLADLLPYLEQDEARHVNVGASLLPELIDQMGPIRSARFWLYQMQLFRLEIAGLDLMAPHMAVLGFDVDDVFRLGMGKQLGAAKLVTEQLGARSKLGLDVLRRVMEFTQEWRYGAASRHAGLLKRLRASMRAAGTPAVAQRVLSP